MEDANTAGLLSKNGPWKSYPLRMLAHRARAWAIRDGAADALMGMQVAEEVRDYQPMRNVTPAEPEAPRMTAAQRIKQMQEAPQEAEVLPPEDAGGDVLTPEQRAEIEAAQEAFTLEQEHTDEHQ